MVIGDCKVGFIKKDDQDQNQDNSTKSVTHEPSDPNGDLYS